jgi:uncharacterized small protein (TIGR04563 family)
MPEYLEQIEIDWGWPRLSEPERGVARRHEALLQADPTTHTLETLREALAAASAELRGRDVRARAADDGGEYALAARDGKCVEVDDDAFDPEGAFPDRLTPDDYRAAGVTKLYVTLFWTQGLLDAVAKEARRLDRSLSWLVQKAWTLAKSAPAGAGVELPRDGARRRQSVYLPIDIYAELSDAAAREDSSMSMLVRRALCAAWPALDALRPEP